jgi:L,D-transpeptidase catalytic domain/Putative peptidoglycan binding domain
MGRGFRWSLYTAGIAAVAAVAAAGSGVAGATPADRTRVTAPAQAAVYVPPKHNIYFGDSGPAVKSVQQRLTQLHYYVGPIDGTYGMDTAEAVWAFKAVQGIHMTSTNNKIINLAFRRALVDPKRPYVFVKSGPRHRVEVNLRRQVLVLYNSYGHIVWILHVSSGGGYYFCNPSGGCGYAVTPDGNFKAYSFTPGWHKSPLCPTAVGCMYNSVWIDPAAGVAIHGDPTVPWYPASHGCVRIAMDAATWFYEDLTIGGTHATPVYVRRIAPYDWASVGYP